MLYWLEVYALAATPILAMAGLVILSLLVWREGQAYAAARYRMYKRISTPVAQPIVFANRLAISRTFSRSDSPVHSDQHKTQ